MKMYLGIAPFQERHPTIEQNGRNLLLQVGEVWKKQLMRSLNPPFITLISIEKSPPDHGSVFEVVLTIKNIDDDKLRWINEIEHDELIDIHWDEQSLDELEKINWLVNMRRK